MKFTTVRTWLALAALKGHSIKQADVTTVYLNAKVKEELYMRQPDGFEITSTDGKDKVLQLKKFLYNLATIRTPNYING